MMLWHLYSQRRSIYLVSCVAIASLCCGQMARQQYLRWPFLVISEGVDVTITPLSVALSFHLTLSSQWTSRKAPPPQQKLSFLFHLAALFFLLPYLCQALASSVWGFDSSF